VKPTEPVPALDIASLPLWKRIVFNLILLSIPALLTLGAVEFLLRRLAPDLAGEPVTSNQYNFYRYDALLGWSNTPGSRGVIARSEFSYDLSINSLGLRGPEITVEKPQGVRRIAVLGDSFVWGIGASDPELFTTQLQQRIPGTEVLNFGVSGYGPVQYQLLTEQVLRLAPDAVVIGFCLGNDFADSVMWRRYGYYKPYALIDRNGELVIEGFPIPNVKRFPSRYDSGLLGWLHERSYLFRLANKHALGLVGRMEFFGQKGLADFDENQADVYLAPDKPSVKEAVRITGRLLERITQAYAARGIPVIVLAVPSACEMGRCFDIGKRTDASRKALREAVGALPVTFIDPTEALTEADFWVKDGHWRLSGHNKIADALEPGVRAALSRRATAEK
jgi:lysophospholipase L1-like esterase